MSREKKILLIIIFNLIIIVLEILFGIISNSFALIADALHNAGDVLAVIITYIALKVSTKTTTFKQTFGFIRAEMMAAFVNTLFLYLTMIYMIYEAINRFFNPEIINPIYMIGVGIVAVIANGISAYILNNLGVEHCHGHSHDDKDGHHHHTDEGDANIRSAYLHMLGDALISVAVVVAGIFIYFFKIYYIDSVLTIIFSLYILFHSYSLLKKSFLSLMDMNIIDIKKEQLDTTILEDGVLQYHDLHIHKPSSKHNFISFHLVLEDNMVTLEAINELKNKIKHKLEHLGFNHIIIEVDSKENLKHQINCSL